MRSNNIMIIGLGLMMCLAFAWPRPSAKSTPIPLDIASNVDVLIIPCDTPNISIPASTIDSYQKNRQLILKNRERARQQNKDIKQAVDRVEENLAIISQTVVEHKDTLVVKNTPPVKVHGWIYSIFHKNK